MKLSQLSKTLLIAGVALTATASSFAGEISDRVEKTKTLIVGTEGTYAPFNFHKDGKLTGFDIDVITEVAKRLGLKVKFEETQWDAMFAGLNAKRFDLIADQVEDTPERVKKYDFSDPYDFSRIVVITNKDNDTIKSFDDLKGLKAAQNLTTSYNKIAKAHGADVVVADSLVQILELVRQKRVDAAVNDKLAVLSFLQQHPKAGVKIAAQQDETVSMHFAFLKGEDELKAKINKALSEMRKDGTLKQISLKWFNDDITN